MDEKYKYVQLASFVDGEGTIGIERRENYHRNSYHQRLSVMNTNIVLISWLVDNFGGNFPNPQKHENGNHKDAYQWRLSGKNSYKMIKKIREHLLLKRDQADCAIDLYEQVTKWHYGNGKPIPKYKQELSEALYQKCKKLNKRGPPDDEDEEYEVTFTIKKKKDHTWNDYGTISKDDEEEEE